MAPKKKTEDGSLQDLAQVSGSNTPGSNTMGDALSAAGAVKEEAAPRVQIIDKQGRERVFSSYS